MGMTCFSDHAEQFGDITQTLRTLFSVVNGDIIYDTFHAIEFAGIGGQLYIYIYILIFTYGKYLFIPLLLAYDLILMTICCTISGVNDDYCYCRRSIF